MNLTILHSVYSKLATKRYRRDVTGLLRKQEYGHEKWWLAEVASIPNFDALVDRLNRGLNEPLALAVRGAPKVGIDISQPILRRSNGEDATIEDVPSRVLHLDIDRVDESHLDVVNRPDEARQHVLDLIGEAAPELSEAACWWSWSCSAGVDNVTKVKIHIWYHTACPYTCAELNRWGYAVNERAGFTLVDLSLFRPVQPNYVARPLFRNMSDPFPGPLRSGVIKGHEPKLVIPAYSAHRQHVNGKWPSVHTSSGGIDLAIQSMGDGEGKAGFHGPWNRAVALQYAMKGPDVDPRPLLARLAARIRHSSRGDKYFRAELLGMIRRCRKLAAKERAPKASR